jgi:hypothetical protein
MRTSKAAIAVVSACAGLLAIASGANAAVFRPAPGLAGLQQAIAQSNSNPGTDTIVLGEGIYTPTSPQTFTDNVVLEGDHGNQGAAGGVKIDAGSMVPLQADSFTVAAGVTLKMSGVLLTSGSDQGFAAMRVRGTAQFDSVALIGNGGFNLAVENGASAVVNNSSISDGNATGVSDQNGSTVTFNNDTIVRNASGGVGGGAARFNNTVIADNDPNFFGVPNCIGVQVLSTTHSMDSDGSCGVASTNEPSLGQPILQGGPTPSSRPDPGSPLIGAGDPAVCTSTDQRFFVRGSGCDIGSFQTTAARDTTAPSCVVTATRTGPPKQQDVTLSDAQSGIGYDGIYDTSDVTIDNGTVAWTPLSSVSVSNTGIAGLVVTATKGNQALLTHWSFIARDWAGNVKTCS